jgi:SPP1 gp7 family putative phage head morphogenesis protein
MPEPIKLGFNQPFYRAVEELKKRDVVLPDKYYGELQGLHRQLNFSIAGKASLDQLQAVLDSLEEAMNKGKTFHEWKKDVRVQDLGLPKHRLDNIFRTNIQAAYNRGHWEKFVEHQKARPYLMYDAINDSRVRPSHLAMDGIIRPVGDVFWTTHYPPNGFRCRCRCISLNERQAQERSKNGTGLNKSITSEMNPDKGFDYNVGQDLTAGIDKAIAESKANPVLKSAFESKLKTTADMKIIALEQFAPVQKAVSELAIKNPNWFPDGFNGIHAVDRSDMFAGIEDGTIYFSIADNLVNGFKPAEDLANAIAKANTAQKLTFNEEYAVETLWHEIKHSIYKHQELPTKATLKSAIEAIVQFTARHSYTSILTELKLTESNQQRIIYGGYAYDIEVANFRKLLDILGLDEKEIAVVTDRILNNNEEINLLVQEVSAELSTLTGYSASRISYALKSLENVSGFSQKVTHKLNY